MYICTREPTSLDHYNFCNPIFCGWKVKSCQKSNLWQLQAYLQFRWYV